METTDSVSLKDYQSLDSEKRANEKKSNVGFVVMALIGFAWGVIIGRLSKK